MYAIGEKNGTAAALGPRLRRAPPRVARYRVMKNRATLLSSDSTGTTKHSVVPVMEQSMPMTILGQPGLLASRLGQKGTVPF